MDDVVTSTLCVTEADREPAAFPAVSHLPPQVNLEWAQNTVRVPIEHIRDADSPRSGGIDAVHAESLAQLEVDLPPIIIQRSTMRVIDGMHRLTAARLEGRSDVRARFLDCGDHDAFIMAVQLNVTHGMPLSIADRSAAARRILGSHPHLSDRSIARTAGLAAKTVSALRQKLGLESGEARLGHDGKIRPLNGAVGRQAAADLIAERPDATLREIARQAGISVETARSVRERIRTGQDPVLDRRKDGRSLPRAPVRQVAVKLPEAPADLAEQLRNILEAIRRDPKLRYTEAGRSVLYWLGSRVLIPDEIPASVQQIPPHCRLKIGELARSCAAAWIQLALALDSGQDGAVPDPG